MPARLATHLGVARSTLSEALKRLVALGFVERARGGVLLSAQGARAIRDTSVLETERLRTALGTLSARELRLVTAGMTALAGACRASLPNGGERWRP